MREEEFVSNYLNSKAKSVTIVSFGNGKYSFNIKGKDSLNSSSKDEDYYMSLDSKSLMKQVISDYFEYLKQKK